MTMTMRGSMQKVHEFKLRGRQVIAGDFVKIAPTPGKRDGFEGKVKYALVDEDGELVEVTVFGGRSGRAPSFRSVRPIRVTTFSQETQKRKRRVE
jgi:hypothetical protein